VLIAQAVFLLERGRTDRQPDATERPTHAGDYADEGNDITSSSLNVSDNHSCTAVNSTNSSSRQTRICENNGTKDAELCAVDGNGA